MKSIKTWKALLILIFTTIAMIAIFTFNIFSSDKMNVIVLENVNFNFTDDLDFYECNQNLDTSLINCELTSEGHTKSVSLTPDGSVIEIQ